MIVKTAYSVHAVSSDDRQRLANLLHFETNVHRHLDWRAPLEWIGAEPFLLAAQDGCLVGALACPPDPPGVAWIRVFGAANDADLWSVWEPLWSEAAWRLRAAGDIRCAAAIPLQGWFQELLARSGFAEVQRVVMLNWESGARGGGAGRGGALPPARPTPAWLRPMSLDDLPQVTAVDQAAFTPIWQNSQDSLELAFRQATIASVAEVDGQVIAYQISTATPLGGHLARLAVQPGWQGQNIGFALVHDLLAQFKRRGAQVVTVNTQHDNPVSQALYLKMGFKYSGEEYPIYLAEIK